MMMQTSTSVVKLSR